MTLGRTGGGRTARRFVAAAAAGLAMLAPAAAREGEAMKRSGPAALDRPEILAVVFHPRPEPPGAARDGYERLAIPVSGGAELGARFYRAGPADPVILFFHGNGEIVDDYHELARVYVARGLGFLPVDYRGYGRSTGRPTLAGLMEDARAAHRFARDWLRAAGCTGPLLAMGRSLGSAAALEIAAADPGGVDGLIIESGFAHGLALLRRLGAPVDGLEAEPGADLGQLAKIRRFQGPTLILHGSDDHLIPVADAEDLFEASPAADKRLVRITGAHHNNLLAVGFAEYFDAVSALARRAAVRPVE